MLVNLRIIIELRLTSNHRILFEQQPEQALDLLHQTLTGRLIIHQITNIINKDRVIDDMIRNPLIIAQLPQQLQAVLLLQIVTVQHEHLELLLHRKCLVDVELDLIADGKVVEHLEELNEIEVGLIYLDYHRLVALVLRLVLRLVLCLVLEVDWKALKVLGVYLGHAFACVADNFADD